MAPNLNHTHIRLIPKVTAPKKVSDYRPIALCNVLYKFIAKVLANRLKKILDNIISETQSAFVPGRAIADNVMITHKVLYYLQHSTAKERCYMAVKTDMSKAYDRLEWSFIKRVFERMGFHPKWVRWISLCVSTVSYSYLVNDTALEKVVLSRGLRQRDPISPYIFIMCSEELSGLCLREERLGSLEGIRVSTQGPRVNHLLFADDNMFFCRTDESNCLALKRVLSTYESLSGQKINELKSSVTFSNKTPATIRLSVKNALGIHSDGGNGKYLGLPESFSRKKRDIFASILYRMRHHVTNWATHFLSSGGKLTLLKAVLTAIPNYSMSCFQLPMSLCRSI